MKSVVEYVVIYITSFFIFNSLLIELNEVLPRAYYLDLIILALLIIVSLATFTQMFLGKEYLPWKEFGQKVKDNFLNLIITALILDMNILLFWKNIFSIFESYSEHVPKLIFTLASNIFLIVASTIVMMLFSYALVRFVTSLPYRKHLHGKI